MTKNAPMEATQQHIPLTNHAFPLFATIFPIVRVIVSVVEKTTANRIKVQPIFPVTYESIKLPNRRSKAPNAAIGGIVSFKIATLKTTEGIVAIRINNATIEGIGAN